MHRLRFGVSLLLLRSPKRTQTKIYNPMTKIESTTILGAISAQSIVSAVAESDTIFTIEQDMDGTAYVAISTDGIAQEADLLHEIYASDFPFEPSDDDLAALKGMLQAEAERTEPTIEELTAPGVGEEAAAEHDRTESEAIRSHE